MTEAEARGADDADLAAALASARDQQAAVSDILRVISRSSKDLQAVFDVIARSARRFCSAEDAMVALVEGDRLVGRAHDGAVGWVLGSTPLDRQLPAGRCIVDGRPIHVRDMQTESSDDFRTAREIAMTYGIHTVLATPMFHDGKAIGSITLRRTEVRPFTDEQIALVRTFADQAVIAIENVRLFNETKEALARQTALAEILRVIADSPADQQPVVDAIARNTTRYCGAEDAAVFLLEGDALRRVAHHGPLPVVSSGILPLDRGAVAARAVLERRTIHVADISGAEGDEFLTTRARAEVTGQRGTLATPMLREGTAIGAILLRKMDTNGFTPSQIQLVAAFADQAVIAIENVRLFNETKESLGQQTALSDVLRTISRSAFDLDAVLQTIVERAAALVGAGAAAITRREGDEAVVLAQFGSMLPASQRPGTRIPVVQRTAVGRAILTRKRQYIADAAEDPDLAQSGPRTRLVIPFLRDGTAIGTLGVTHNLPKPIGDREMEMLETFADQAAIAIENVRLFNETREALEQQTAIAGVLEAMNASRFDQQPVLQELVDRAAKLCEADYSSISLWDGSAYVTSAWSGEGIPTEYVQLMVDERRVPGRTTLIGRTALERRTIHVADVLEEAEYEARAMQEAAGYRTMLGVPLLRDGFPIGIFALTRQEVRLFSDRQIQLVETFAQQAVIAIENVRLFNETKEALKQRTATSEILRVISETLGDPQPVMQAIVDTVLGVCAADNAGFFRRSGDDLVLSAVSGTWRGPGPRGVGRLHAFHGDSIVAQAFQDGRWEHVPDTAADPRYDAAAGWSRTRLAVPVLRGSETLGVIRVGRTAPGGFSEREIQLVEGFAEQAAIAFENARLFNETKEALERQTAVAGVLSAISRSGFELRPVLDTVIEHATKLCAAQQGFIYRREGDVFRLVVAHGITPEFKAFTEANPLNPAGRGTVAGRVAEDRMAVHIPDVLADPDYTYWEAQRLGGFRAILGVPMMRDDEVIGVMLLWRTEPQPFTDDQITLVTTFANQATIAIENVRLFDETKEALEQQRAISDVLRTISGTVFELRPTLQTVVQNAATLADADLAWMSQRSERDAFTWGARYARTPELARVFEENFPDLDPQVTPGTGQGLMSRLYVQRRTIALPDIEADAELLEKSRVAKATGVRSVVGVPIVSESNVVGAIVLARREVRPFSEREVRVVETFADQAAIAIGNVRLFNEIQDKSRELEVASRHKSEFLANMSHELRTPLNAIIGFSEVLIQGLFGDVNEKQREYLQDVIGSGQHLLSLINDILDLSKIEAGRMELELSMFSFRSALESGVTIVRERAARHGIALNVDLSGGLSQVEADERKVKQILYNLLSNAVKFTPDGGTVKVTVRPDNGNVRVDVQDNGIGIAEPDQARIFEEFQQVGRERSREGTGLGLTLTKRFVELHGGRIWLESAPGRGSTFTFTLPLRQAAPVRA